MKTNDDNWSPSIKMDKYEYLTGEEIFPFDHSRIIEQGYFFPFRKSYRKTNKGQLKSEEKKKLKL